MRRYFGLFVAVLLAFTLWTAPAYAASVSSTFSSATAVESVTTGLRVARGDAFDYSLSGTFVATVTLESSGDGGQSWRRIQNFTAAASGFLFNEDLAKSSLTYRLRLTAFTSGTITATLSDRASELREVGRTKWENSEGRTILRLTEDGIETGGDLTISGLTASGVVTTDADGTLTSTALTNGQVLIGKTGASPVASTLTAGSGTTITNGAGSITINSTGTGGTLVNVKEDAVTVVASATALDFTNAIGVTASGTEAIIAADNASTTGLGVIQLAENLGGLATAPKVIAAFASTTNLFWDQVITNGHYLSRSGTSIVGSATASPTAHALNHENGGSDEVSISGLSGLAADAQNVKARRNSGADVGPQPRLNFIEGPNISITVASDAASSELDITFSTVASGTLADVREDGVNVVTSARILDFTSFLGVAASGTDYAVVSVDAASTTAAGAVQLSGDLGGLYTAPKVIALTTASGTGTQLYTGTINDGEFLKRVGTTITSGTVTAGATASGTAGQVAYFDGASSLTSETDQFGWDATANLLSIGTSFADTGAMLQIRSDAGDTFSYGVASSAGAVADIRRNDSTGGVYYQAFVNNASGDPGFLSSTSTNWFTGINQSYSNQFFIQNAASLSDVTYPAFSLSTGTGATGRRAGIGVAISDFSSALFTQSYASSTGIGLYNSSGDYNGSQAPLLLSADNASGTTSNVSVEARSVSLGNTEMVFRTAGTGSETLGTERMTIQNDGDVVFATSVTMGNDAMILRDVNAGVTASTTQTQGNGALTADVNEIATIANPNDTVTLPAAVAGRKVVIINNGANTLQIFPASGDNLGAGVDTATTLASGSNRTYIAYDGTNWEIP